MACVDYMGPYAPADVMKCTTSVVGPEGPITQDLVLRSCGPIPWKIVAERILRENPSMSTKPKQGDRGGLAMTSIGSAVSRNLDLRHPWTSVFDLIQRIRGFVDKRLADYSNLWSEVYSEQAKSAGWPHVWAPCIHFADLTFYQDQSFLVGQAGLHVLHQYPFHSTHVIQYPENLRALGWDRFYHGWNSQKCCADCTNTDPLNLTTGISAVLHGVYDYCRCGSYAGQILSGMQSRVAVLYAQPRPRGWPNLLMRDQGFWALILLEERIPPGVMDRLWGVLLGGGLPKLLGRGVGEVNYAAGTMMAHGGQVLGRNMLETALLAVEENGDRIAGGDMSVTDLQTQMTAVAQMLAAAVDPTGYPKLSLDEVLGTGTYSTTQLLLVQQQTTAGVTDETRRWAGTLYIETPRPLTEAEVAAAVALAPPEENTDIARPPAPPAGTSKASLAGPLILGASVLVAGLLGWKAWTSRQESDGSRGG